MHNNWFAYFIRKFTADLLNVQQNSAILILSFV